LFYATTKDYQQVKDRKDNLFGLWDYQKKMVQEYLRNKFLLTVPEKSSK